MQAEIIDRLFINYFERHHKYLPILDAALSPNAYYERCEFLFWTILAASCQTFTEDPTIYLTLAPKVNGLAVDSIKIREQYIYAIQGILILITWPLIAGDWADISFTIGGAALHMAMTQGFHNPVSTQEYFKNKITLTEADLNIRAELWTQCLISHGRVCSMKGIAAMRAQAIAPDPDVSDAIAKRIRPELAYHLRLHRVVMRCFLALQKNGLINMSVDQERAMLIFIHLFTEQLADMQHEAVTDQDRMLHAISQLQCLSFHFFKVHEPIDEQSLVALHTVACSIIRMAKMLDDTEGFLLSISAYIRSGVLIAAYTLLRLLKSPFGKYLGPDVRDILFIAINMSRKASKGGGDPADRHGTALSQLYHSTKAFKKPDGSDFTVLRIRSRLAMSPALDAAWWWKEEFQGQKDALPVNTKSKFSKTSNIVVPDAYGLQSMNPNSVADAFGVFDNQLLADFNMGNQFNDGVPAGWPSTGFEYT